MMNFQASKRVRKHLRELAEMAYERELRELLAELDQSFHRWRQGAIDSIDLAGEVEQFARSPEKRRLSQQYSTNAILHLSVAQAIVRGILKPEEVPDEVRDALANAIAVHEEKMADGTISFDERDEST